MSQDSGIHGSQLVYTFLAGAAVGAVAALLLTPKTGREVRDALGDWARTAGDQASHLPGAVAAAYDRASRAAKDAFVESLRSETPRSTDEG